MKRRDFLKLIGVAPIAPSVLTAKEKPLPFKPNDAQKIIAKSLPEGGRTINRPIGFAAEDIPKDKYGWVWVGITIHYAE